MTWRRCQFRSYWSVFTGVIQKMFFLSLISQRVWIFPVTCQSFFRLCPDVCSKSPVPVGSADEPSQADELQRHKVTSRCGLMSQVLHTHFTNKWSSLLPLSAVCGFMLIGWQQQGTPGSGGGAQTHAAASAGRGTQHQSIQHDRSTERARGTGSSI